MVERGDTGAVALLAPALFVAANVVDRRPRGRHAATRRSGPAASLDQSASPQGDCLAPGRARGGTSPGPRAPQLCCRISVPSPHDTNTRRNDDVSNEERPARNHARADDRDAEPAPGGRHRAPDPGQAGPLERQRPPLHRPAPAVRRGVGRDAGVRRPDRGAGGPARRRGGGDGKDGGAAGAARALPARHLLRQRPLRGALVGAGGLRRAVRQGIEEADAAGDKDTSDLFTEISRGTDQWLWFVEAHLQADA